MLKITKNKNGFIASSIVLLICFITFCIVALIFYVLFSFAGKLSVYDIQSNSKSLDANYVLLNYLRTPVEVDGNEMNMADLIVLSVNKGSYDNLIKITSEILGRDDIFYSIMVYDKAEHDAVQEGEKFYWTPQSAGFKVQMASSDDIVPYNEDLISSYNEAPAEMVIPSKDGGVPLIKVLCWYSKGKKLTGEEAEQRDLSRSGGGI